MSKMDGIEHIGDSNQNEIQNQTIKKDVQKTSFNSDATPFIPLDSGEKAGNQTYKTFTLKVPLDSKIWKSISACSPHIHRFTVTKRQNYYHGLPLKTFSEPLFNCSLMMDVSPDGFITIHRKDNIHIELSLDRAIRIDCPAQRILLCVSSSTMATAIFHPNGRVFQNNARVDIVAFDGSHQNNLFRYAKLWQKGISFMAKDIPLVYLVDEAGLRSSVDHFIHIKKDYASDVFNKNIRHNSFSFDEAVDMMQKAIHSQTMDGSESIEINQIKITSNSDETISIEGPNNTLNIRINPRKAAISLTTLHIHATASMGKSPHLFIRQGDRRIHFDGTIFCVRNGGYSAGFDEKNQVTIFNKNSTP